MLLARFSEFLRAMLAQECHQSSLGHTYFVALFIIEQLSAFLSKWRTPILAYLDSTKPH